MCARRRKRPRWQIVLGLVLIASGMVLAAQDNNAGLVIALAGGVLAVVGVVRVD